MTVVMADPSHDHALEEIARVTGCRIQAFVGTVTEIETAIRRQYKISEVRVLKGGDDKAKMTLRDAAEKKMREESQADAG